MHTPEFEEAVGGPTGHHAVAVGAKAMAMTAVDLLENPELLKAVKQAFQEMKAQYE